MSQLHNCDVLKSSNSSKSSGVGVQVTMCYITSDIPALLLCFYADGAIYPPIILL